MQYRPALIYSKENDFRSQSFYWRNCSQNNSEEFQCELSGWPVFSQTIIQIDFLFVSHTQLNESLLLDGFNLFGQIGGTAGKPHYNILLYISLLQGLLTGASVLSLLQIVGCCWQIVLPMNKCAKCEKDMTKRASRRLTRRSKLTITAPTATPTMTNDAGSKSGTAGSNPRTAGAKPGTAPEQSSNV